MAIDQTPLSDSLLHSERPGWKATQPKMSDAVQSCGDLNVCSPKKDHEGVRQGLVEERMTSEER